MAPSAIIHSSACPAWASDTTAQTVEEQRSYTTSWGTIYPDVATAVRDKHFASAADHYRLCGLSEGRAPNNAALANSSHKISSNGIKLAFPPGHYYSPIVNPTQAIRYGENSWDRRPVCVAGIPIDLKRMERFWLENLDCIKKTPFPDNRDNRHRYYFNNNVFPAPDAIILRALIQSRRPQRIIEIGSGFSTACILDAVEEVSILPFSLTCIEPDTSRIKQLLSLTDQKKITIFPREVQEVPLSTFSTLTAGDILFIDSTHILKTGSDVHFELFHILPVLAPGVLVHFHDVFWPFEYTKNWIVAENFSWNEAYGLRTSMSPSTAPATHAGVPTNHIMPGQIRVTKMDGASVYDTNTQKIGDIKDMILDRDGRVAAVVLDVGATLGVGGKYVAVSMSDIHVRMDENNAPHFSVDMTKDQLKAAQAYDLSEKDVSTGTSTPPSNLNR